MGFEVHNSIRSAVTHFHPKNKRLCAIVVAGKTRSQALICCHAPWNSKRLVEAEDNFYNAISKMCAGLPNRAVKVVLGDVNARVGWSSQWTATLAYSLTTHTATAAGHG